MSMEPSELRAVASNPDAATTEDLLDFWHATHTNPVRTARQIFDPTPGYVEATKDLGNYASNKATAMRCRLNGDIQTAQMYERICDKIYAGLPSFAKLW